MKLEPGERSIFFLCFLLGGNLGVRVRWKTFSVDLMNLALEHFCLFTVEIFMESDSALLSPYLEQIRLLREPTDECPY